MSPPARAASNGTVLVVEDQEDIQLTVRLSLEVDGFLVLVASNAREALSAIERAVPDVILLDITLPEVSGWELLAKLRADERFASIPIIVLSALPHDQVEHRAAALGASHLTKPFDVVRLTASVRGAIEARERS